MSVAKFVYRMCENRLGCAAARQVVRIIRWLGGLRSSCLPLEALELDAPVAAGLMRLWQRMHWSSGDGMMPADQLLNIYRLAATWPGQGDIVELGSWVGLTTSYLATACGVRGEGHVWAVDTFEGTKEGGASYPSIERFDGSTLEAFGKQISQAGVEKHVSTMVGYTTEMAKEYRGLPIRVLFIDADHSYDGVRADFETWWPHVAPGGLIIFHDYLMADVARFVDEVVGHDGRVACAPGHVVPNVFAVTKKAMNAKSVSSLRLSPGQHVRVGDMKQSSAPLEGAECL